jgi:hypothetical protein
MTDNTALAKSVRSSLWHYLSFEVAAAAGISFEQMRLFMSGSVELTDAQLMALARRIHIET